MFIENLFTKSCETLTAFAIILFFLLTGCEKNEALLSTSNDDSSVSLKLSTSSTNLSISSVSASTSHSSYPPSNAIDGSLSTRWAGYGSAVNFYINLSSSAKIDYLKMAFYKGSSKTYSFKIYTRATTSDAWTLVGTKTSSGTSSELEIFDVVNSTGRYIKIIALGSSVDYWNNYTEIDVYGTSVSDDDTSDSSYPTAVLGITEKTWKINSFVGDPDDDPTYYDDITDASGIDFDTYSDPYYFFTDGEWVSFKCYRGLGGSSNSDNPRVELREMDGGGDEVYWTNEGTNTMEWTVRCDQLSKASDGSTGVTCVGQIHGPGSSVDDIIRVQFYGSAGQTSGSCRIKISGYITEEVLGSSQFLDGTYYLDTEYTMKLAYNSDDYVTLYIDGSKVFSQKIDTDEDDNYFKVGNYVQSSKDTDYDGSYCLVKIKDLTVTHTN